MQIPLGEVKPNSTTVALRATNNVAAALQATYACQAIQFQALAANTGSIFICDRQTPTLTSHVHYEILAPNASPATRPAYSVGNPSAPNPINAGEYWILPAVSGEGVRVSVLVG